MPALRLTIVVPTLALAACVPSGHLARYQTDKPDFDAIAFFAGQTRGTGSLVTMGGRHQAIKVESLGVVQPDGTIVLDQAIRRGDRAAAHRTWRLRRVGSGRFVGTLTDAVGPVTGDVHGNQLHLRFTMKGGLAARQWLYLEADGQTARNRMVVSKFGMPVASLDETIVRVGL